MVTLFWFFFFKQKTAYEITRRDWSSDVCSSDLTRGHADRKHFSEILLEGLAPDGGLYLPEHYPKVDATTLAKWRKLPYPELAFEVLSLYIDDIPAADLKAICEKTYTPEIFGTKEIVPLRKLEDGL